MNCKEIPEEKALSTLIQVYLSHTAKWYSALVALTLGLLVIPLFALNASLSNWNFGFELRLVFSVLTLLFLDASIYTVAKVIYSLALLSEFYGKLKIIGVEKTLAAYLIEVKKGLRDKVKAFRIFKMEQSVRSKFQIVGSIIGFLLIGAILFSFVWWEYDCFFLCLVISEAIYLVSILTLLRVVQIF